MLKFLLERLYVNLLRMNSRLGFKAYRAKVRELKAKQQLLGRVLVGYQL